MAGATLDVDRLAGDVTRTEEPHHRVDDVVGLAAASDEGPGRVLSQQGGPFVTKAIPRARVPGTRSAARWRAAYSTAPFVTADDQDPFHASHSLS